MKPLLRWGCVALFAAAAISPALADDIPVDSSQDFVSLDALPDYTPDPTDDPTLDPLHGFCYGLQAGCYSNGTVTPTAIDPPKFGFTISPGPQTGDYMVDLLVPVNEVVNASSLSFALTETQGGVSNTSTVNATATLYNSTPWTSGTLAQYFKFTASPTNPLSAWLPYTQAHGDPGATGYYVYVADFGQTKLLPNPSGGWGPLLSLQTGLPTGSLIVGFLNTTKNGEVATANSGAIFVSGSPSAPVPEPGTLSMLGMALAGVTGGLWIRRKS